MTYTDLKPARPTLMNNPVFPPVNITGLTIALTCAMLILTGAFKTPSPFSTQTGPASAGTTNRCFNGKMCIGPDMMYSLPKADRPVLLATGFLQMSQSGSCTE